MTSTIIDIPSAKERFMGNFALFSKFLYQFPQRSLYSQLQEQIQAGDVQAAFASAHTMKGIAANLSLKALEGPIAGVVEPLRIGQIPSAEAQDELAQAYAQAVAEIQRLQAEGANLFA